LRQANGRFDRLVEIRRTEIGRHRCELPGCRLGVSVQPDRTGLSCCRKFGSASLSVQSMGGGKNCFGASYRSQIVASGSSPVQPLTCWASDHARLHRIEAHPNSRRHDSRL